MKRRWLRLLIAAAVCLVLSLSTLGTKALITAGYDSQKMADRWQTDTMRYSQLTWFLPESSAYSPDSAEIWRRSIDNAYAGEAITAANNNARLWLDCYSAVERVNIANGENGLTARAIVTGGDFFTFHPIELISGWYYTGSDLMDDRVILDKNLAWKLFGGYELSGMSISINGHYCIVAGVCELPEQKAENRAYADEPTVYIPASLMERLGTQLSITCYEVVAPDPVRGFAAEKVGQALGFAEGNFEFVENSSRFSVINSLRVVSDFGFRSQRLTDIYYPWWENAARYIEAWCALLVVASCVFVLPPALCVITAVCWAIVRRDRVFKAVAKLTVKQKNRLKRSEIKEESQ